MSYFFFQAEDGIRDLTVTGVQTCALPILRVSKLVPLGERVRLELIAEGFNLFNRFNEAAASPFIDDVREFNQRAGNGRYYSRPTAAFDPRQFQFGLKLNF